VYLDKIIDIANIVGFVGVVDVVDIDSGGGVVLVVVVDMEGENYEEGVVVDRR
jgi:hypothetical protein